MDAIADAGLLIDHHPGFRASPETPSYFALVDHFATGERIEDHIHMSMDEVLTLVRASLENLRLVTVGAD